MGRSGRIFDAIWKRCWSATSREAPFDSLGVADMPPNPGRPKRFFGVGTETVRNRWQAVISPARCSLLAARGSRLAVGPITICHLLRTVSESVMTKTRVEAGPRKTERLTNQDSRGRYSGAIRFAMVSAAKAATSPPIAHAGP